MRCADEVRGWRTAGVDFVVSLLEEDEANQLGLAREGALAEAEGIRFRSFPIGDRQAPASTAATLSLLHEIVQALEAGMTVALHCRQSVGRAGMIASAALAVAGTPVWDAIRIVTEARGCEVPETADQVRWLGELPSPVLAGTRISSHGTVSS